MGGPGRFLSGATVVTRELSDAVEQAADARPRMMTRPKRKHRCVMNMPARLQWFRPEQGGRAEPPTGPTYSTVARFDQQTEDQWLENAWSLVVECRDAPDSERAHAVTVRFLAEDGPIHFLAPGREFSLYEGRRKVAEGTVLASS